MISISKLYCGTIEPGDVLRYGRRTKDLPSNLLQFSADKKPVVVWNATQSCNLHCKHCYANSEGKKNPNELTTAEAKEFIKDLAAFGAPVLLFSGGEPLLREDIFELGDFAREQGLRIAFSTNGTLITEKIAQKMKDIGASYAGISLDGLGKTHDYFRQKEGAFNMTLAGIKNCQKYGIKDGVRFTINKKNQSEIGAMFDFVEKEHIQRLCFYHLVYTGRGSGLSADELTHEETRKAVDLIIDRTADLIAKGSTTEVFTVDNHADGVYLYLWMKKENNPRAEKVLELLQMNGGNSSGNGFGCVSWDGEVYPDQFWRQHSLGNVKKRKFSEIWTDLSNPLLKNLRDRKKLLKGRCSKCKWVGICNGNFRAQAEAKTGDMWAESPTCYLTAEEID